MIYQIFYQSYGTLSPDLVWASAVEVFLITGKLNWVSVYGANCSLNYVKDGVENGA